MHKTGDVDAGQFSMIAEPDADIKGGDIVTVLTELESGRIGRITDCGKIFDFSGTPHHAEANMVNIL